MEVMVLGGDNTRERLCQGGVCIGQRAVRQRDKTLGSQHLLGYQDVLGQVTRQSVANSNFIDDPVPISIALQVVDGWMVHRRLDDVALSRVVALAQLLP